MVSIIVCSVDESSRALFLQNVSNTIGLEHEFIIFDNRLKGNGICQVYNECAERSVYEYLCFVHEDVLFGNDGWGKRIVAFLENDPLAGIVGVAGGMYVPRNFVSWNDNHEYARCNWWHLKQDGESLHYSKNPYKEQFSEVVTLDGVLLFTKKDVWRNVRFDSDVFNGFHLYDADFSLNVATGYRNYVDQSICLYHKSKGHATSREYYDHLKKFHVKWKKTLPFYKDDARGMLRFRYCKEAQNISFLLGKFSEYYSLRESLKHFIAINPFGCSTIVLYLRITKKAARLLICQIVQKLSTGKKQCLNIQ